MLLILLQLELLQSDTRWQHSVNTETVLLCLCLCVCVCVCVCVFTSERSGRRAGFPITVAIDSDDTELISDP